LLLALIDFSNVTLFFTESISYIKKFFIGPYLYAIRPVFRIFKRPKQTCMKKLLITIPVLLSVLCVFSQKTYLKVRLQEQAPISAYLYLNQGSTLIPVDSIILGKEIFTFNTTKLEPGIYSFVLSEDTFARFIINHENVEISTTLEALTDSVIILQSEENMVYYKFLNERNIYNKKADAIDALLGSYPPKNKLAKVLTKEKKSIESSYNNTIRGLINAQGDLLSSQIILSEIPTKAPENLSPEQKHQYLITNWWNSFPFENTHITNTPSIADKLWDYFDLFYVDGISRQEQENYFKRAIDEVLNQPTISKEVQRFFINEMIKNFAQSSHDTLIDYIKKNYLQNTQNLDAEFDRISKTLIGHIAPNFAIKTDSTQTDLLKLKYKGVILVFWSMNCSHCQKLLPELKKNYNRLKDLGYEIVAINLDVYRPAWKLDVVNNAYQWININVQNPYNDPIATNYNVTGTPLIFVLDAEKRIVDKPTDIRSLLKTIDNLKTKK
jgi:thiol-disulfide isomerase/thioredoxin